jgi:hypothetical protein
LLPSSARADPETQASDSDSITVALENSLFDIADSFNLIVVGQIKAARF